MDKPVYAYAVATKVEIPVYAIATKVERPVCAIATKVENPVCAIEIDEPHALRVLPSIPKRLVLD